MANSRFYSSTAQQTTLTSGIGPSNTSILVGSTSGFPGTAPFTLALDYGSAAEELVECTNVAGLTLTVTRAIDGTSAQTHNAGAFVRHVSSARDFTDSRTHEAASTNVHGLSGGAAVVGDIQTQTLTNKTLTSPTINGAALSGTLSGTPTFTGAAVFTGGPQFTTASVLFSRASATNPAIRTSVSGDTQDRLQIQADGKLLWGSGSATQDTNLYRAGANILATDDNIQVTRTTAATDVALSAMVTGDTFDRARMYADGKLEWGPGSGTRDTNLYRSAANTLATDDALTVAGEIGAQSLIRGSRALSTDTQYETRVVGDTNARWFIRTTGEQNWGPGGAGSTDTNLYRAGADNLKTDDTFNSLVTTSTSLTAATNFTLNSAAHRKTGDITVVTGYLQRTTSAINTTSATTTNIVDTLMATLPAGFRPPSTMTTIWSNGLTAGEALIDTDGTVTLRTSGYNQSINIGDNIRFTATWVN